MSSETNLRELIKNIQPELVNEEFIFASMDEEKFRGNKLNPLCRFLENEGISLILRRVEADEKGIHYNSVFKMITLKVHSSLEAVGFLAKITGELAKHQISVNPVSAYYHDHLFIPISKAEEALIILKQMSE